MGVQSMAVLMYTIVCAHVSQYGIFCQPLYVFMVSLIPHDVHLKQPLCHV